MGYKYDFHPRRRQAARWGENEGWKGGKADGESRSLARSSAGPTKASFPAETEVLSPLIKAGPP